MVSRFLLGSMESDIFALSDKEAENGKAKGFVQMMKQKTILTVDKTNVIII
ncbi:MAG: hypothetical protein ACRBBZ_00090 [Nitrosopumilus sp.]